MKPSKISLNVNGAMEQPEATNSSFHSSPKGEAGWSGLKTRVISGVILAAIVLAALAVGGVVFSILIMIAALIMIREWDALNTMHGPAWRLAGLAYTSLPCASIIWLRGQPEGFKLVMF